MEFLLDEVLLKNIAKVTMTILRKNFFYDKECLTKFSNNFLDRLQSEYCQFEATVDDDFRNDLSRDLNIRKHFTSYFASYQLHECLVEDCHFTEFELDQFENLLPKYTGVNDNDTKQRSQRTHN